MLIMRHFCLWVVLQYYRVFKRFDSVEISKGDCFTGFFVVVLMYVRRLPIIATICTRSRVTVVARPVERKFPVVNPTIWKMEDVYEDGNRLLVHCGDDGN